MHKLKHYCTFDAEQQPSKAFLHISLRARHYGKPQENTNITVAAATAGRCFSFVGLNQHDVSHLPQ